MSNTESIDKLFLELSQFTSARTQRELELELARDQARAEVAAMRRTLPPSTRGQGIVCEGSWAVYAEKAVAERDEARALARELLEALRYAYDSIEIEFGPEPRLVKVIEKAKEILK